MAYIFFINILIGVVAVIVGTRYLKDVERTQAKLDLGGMGLLAATLVLLSFWLVSLAGAGIAFQTLHWQPSEPYSYPSSYSTIAD